jgi:hypothetical protein
MSDKMKIITHKYNTANTDIKNKELLLSRVGISPADDHSRGYFQPFFLSAISIALSLGAVWGAWLLLRIAATGSFTSVGIHQVNAHGHAQIFGWVGLFVMGFAYQMFPRFKNTRLAWPRAARATLGLMLGGILLRAGGEAFIDTWPGLLGVASVGSLLEIIAVLIFAAVLIQTMRLNGKPLEAYEAYILCALFWFVVQTVYSAVHFTLISLAPTEEALLLQVSRWQAPLRDLQIHGFALLMILGVSHRILDKLYHLPVPSARRSLSVLALINLAVVAEAGGFVAMRAAGHAWAALWYGGVLLLFGAVAALVWSWRLHQPMWRPDRSVKYIRAAYGWLLLSLAMLVLLPAYQFGLLRVFAPTSHAAEIGFSHAWYGAIRHAATVGFISMMILGVSAKFVPVFSGVDGRTLTPLWAPFLLLNIGCALRVTFQTLTDFTTLAFPLAGVSGLLEVTALTIWGMHLASLMRQRAVAERTLRGVAGPLRTA